MIQLPLILLAAAGVALGDIVTHNGQIFTPGFVVVNAPQPNTPLGGETLHLSLDVTANGVLPLPPLKEDSASQIYNITIFLYSYDTGRNFTVSNATAVEDANLPSLGDIMKQETSSTVKHVNWIWPDCLVGNGQPSGKDSDRGTYNVSIHQNFRLNNTDHYTIFDLPISVTNSIEANENRTSCDVLANTILQPDEINWEDSNQIGALFVPDNATTVEYDSAPNKDSAGTALAQALGVKLMWGLLIAQALLG
ncbi:unnamed protein product [Clonostachys byssicola]|uniref:Uncharacterized protein n=1 Tax=Clonostachys byssicola TaxID=160290 RepID=A0A9N9TZ06_9HYPO|nr:unnamed protein product [Clonostachys byssicola]